MQSTFHSSAYSTRTALANDAFNAETSAYPHTASDHKSPQPRSATQASQRVLFRKSDGTHWLKVVWHPSGALEGFIEQAGKAPQSIGLKGLPSHLKPEHAESAKAFLERTTFKLSDYTVEFLPGLRGGGKGKGKKANNQQNNSSNNRGNTNRRGGSSAPIATASQTTATPAEAFLINPASAPEPVEAIKQTNKPSQVLPHNLNTMLSINYEGQEIQFYIHEVVEIAKQVVRKKLEEIRRFYQGQSSVEDTVDPDIKFLCNMLETRSDGTVTLNENIKIPENFEKIDIADFYSKCLVPKCIKINSLNDVLRFVDQQTTKKDDLNIGWWFEIGGRVIHIKNTDKYQYYASDYGFLEDIEKGIKYLSQFPWIPPTNLPLIKQLYKERGNDLMKWRAEIEIALQDFDKAFEVHTNFLKEIEALYNSLLKNEKIDANTKNTLKKVVDSFKNTPRKIISDCIPTITNEISAININSSLSSIVDKYCKIQTPFVEKFLEAIEEVTKKNCNNNAEYNVLNYVITQIRIKAHDLTIKSLPIHLLEKYYDDLFKIVKNFQSNIFKEELLILLEKENSLYKQCIYNTVKGYINLSLKNFSEKEQTLYEETLSRAICSLKPKPIAKAKFQQFIDKPKVSEVFISLAEISQSIAFLIHNVTECAPLAKLNEDIQIGHQASVLRPVKSYGGETGEPYHVFAKTIKEYSESGSPLSSQDLAKEMRAVLNGEPVQNEDLDFLPNLVAGWFCSEGARNPSSILTYLMILDLLEEQPAGNTETQSKLQDWIDVLIHPENDSREKHIIDLHGQEIPVRNLGGAGPMCSKHSVEQAKKSLENGKPLSCVRQKEGSLILEWISYRVTQKICKVNMHIHRDSNKIEHNEVIYDEITLTNNKNSSLALDKALEKINSLNNKKNLNSKQKKNLKTLEAEKQTLKTKIKFTKEVIEPLLLSRLNTLERLDERYTPEGFTRILILGDGNCLFRAFSKALNGDQNQPVILRSAIMDWIATHPSIGEFDMQGEDLYQYVARLNSDMQYGGEPEIRAFEMLQAAQDQARPVVVHGGRGYGIDEQRQIVRNPEEANNPQAIHLLHHREGGGHYELLVRNRPIIVHAAEDHTQIEGRYAPNAQGQMILVANLEGFDDSQAIHVVRYVEQLTEKWIAS